MKKSKMDLEIERVVSDLSNFDIDSEEYRKGVESLKVLTEARSKNHRFGLSPDTVFSGFISILGILIMVGYEHTHIITSKAIGHLKKL